jgi:hypothetical protein
MKDETARVVAASRSSALHVSKTSLLEGRALLDRVAIDGVVARVLIEMNPSNLFTGRGISNGCLEQISIAACGGMTYCHTSGDHYELSKNCYHDGGESAQAG